MNAHSGDDFLAQVEQAELEAKKTIEKAQKKMAADLLKVEEKEQKKKEVRLEEAREKQKSQLKDTQVKARGEYEKSTEEGKKSAQRLEQEITPKIEKVLPQVQAYFVNELIG